MTNNDDLEAVISNSENHVAFCEDYNDLPTLELASIITGFESSRARKMYILKGMTGRILRYNWQN